MKVADIYNSSIMPFKTEKSQAIEQNTDESNQSGPYLTVEDPDSGYKYVYVVIGKHFKVLISCQPMEKKKEDNSSTNGQQEQTTVKNDVQNPNVVNAQSLLGQQVQKPFFRENLYEKIRIMKQCALLDKTSEKSHS